MKMRTVLFCLLLCGLILVAPACTTRITPDPGADSTPLGPVGPPTQPPSPTDPPPPVTTGPQNTPVPQDTVPPPPELTDWPELTELGTLEGGLPHGVTDTGHYFKGNPEAQVVIIEFSEYQ